MQLITAHVSASGLQSIPRLQEEKISECPHPPWFLPVRYTVSLKPYAGLSATMNANVPRIPRNFLHEGVALLGGLTATVHRRGVNQTKSETSKSTGSVTPAATEAPEASQGAPVTAHPGRFVCTVSADTGQVGSTTAHDLQLPIAGRNS